MSSFNIDCRMPGAEFLACVLTLRMCCMKGGFPCEVKAVLTPEEPCASTYLMICTCGPDGLPRMQASS